MSLFNSNKKHGLQLDPALDLMIIPASKSDNSNTGSQYAIAVQINSENNNSTNNKTLKIFNTKSITELSLKLDGFDSLTTNENSPDKHKVITGSVSILIKREEDGEIKEELLVLEDNISYAVYPLKYGNKKKSDVNPSISEVKEEVHTIWEEEFSYALEDLHQDMCNDFSNKSASPAPRLKEKKYTLKSTNKEGFLKRNWVNIASGFCILLSIAILGYSYIAYTNNSAENISNENSAEQVIEHSVPEINEAQSIENETLD